MTKAKLRDLKNLDDVGRACGVEPDFIKAYACSTNQKSYYNALKIPKRGRRRRGEYRIVFEAREQRLAGFHRSMSMIVSNSSTFGDHVQGFLKKRSTRTNAEQHLDTAILLHADIKGFFDAISTEHIREALVAEGTDVALAAVLARACTIDGLLRQGTRCSPTLANLVCHDMDQAFLKLAKSLDCVYTRYADDLHFSGNEVATDESVRDIIERYGFKLRDGRCYRQYRGRRQYVTGLTVSDSTRPRLPKRLKHQLRTAMHYIDKYGLNDHWNHIGAEDYFREEAWLDGMLRFASSIEPMLVVPWRKMFDAALTKRASERPSQ